MQVQIAPHHCGNKVSCPAEAAHMDDVLETDQLRKNGVTREETADSVVAHADPLAGLVRRDDVRDALELRVLSGAHVRKLLANTSHPDPGGQIKALRGVNKRAQIDVLIANEHDGVTVRG